MPHEERGPTLGRRGFIVSALVIGGSAVLFGGCRRAPDIAEQPIDPFGSDRRDGDPLYSQAAAAYVAVIPAAVLDAAKRQWSPNGIAGNLIALMEDCPFGDLPLRYCSSSQWYVCPGCGSTFNRIGECTGGPAERGMDRRPVSIDPDGQLVIDRLRRLDGPARADGLLLAPDETALAPGPERDRCTTTAILPPNPARRAST